jgi:hypothetical protein
MGMTYGPSNLDRRESIQAPNPKSELRNPKQIQNPNCKFPKLEAIFVLNFLL